MSHFAGIMIESLVAVLLLMTIGYCVLLNKRLTKLKADEHSLKATIAELITVTEIAERAVGGLKLTVREVNENLGGQIAAATNLSDQLKKQLIESDSVVRMLSRIAVAARPAPAATASDTVTTDVAVLTPAKATVAAAQAFSKRRKLSGIAA